MKALHLQEGLVNVVLAIRNFDGYIRFCNVYTVSLDTGLTAVFLNDWEFRIPAASIFITAEYYCPDDVL